MCTNLNKEILTEVSEALNDFKTISEVNEYIKLKTNIRFDFKSKANIDSFIEYIDRRRNNSEIKSDKKKHWGDVQTPKHFTHQVLEVLKLIDYQPEIVFEPTFGEGNFIIAIRDLFHSVSQIYGIEIQSQHIWEFLLKCITKYSNKNFPKTNILHKDFFDSDLEFLSTIDSKKEILIIGNPPWVTNSEMATLNQKNLPNKINYKKMKGLEALTGKSNFDLTEVIIHRLLKLLVAHHGKIALLCKNTVVRNIIKAIKDEDYAISNIWAMNFDAKNVFNKTCNASLFIADIIPEKNDTYCSVCSLSNPFERKYSFGWFKDKFVSNIDNYQKLNRIDGKSQYIWRHGIKHNCSKILELTPTKLANIYQNKLEEKIELEKVRVYPYLKGSDLKGFSVQTPNRFLLLTQKSLGEDTSKIEKQNPKVWQYLEKNKEHFEKRKSRVFNEKTKYSIFGVGDYAFKKFKIAIPSLYKRPTFVLVNTPGKKAFLLDDTCYYLGFDNFEEALVINTILNHQLTTEFLKTIVFEESKRPYTKEILMRIDLLILLEEIPIDDYVKVWNKFDYSLPIEMNPSTIKDKRLSIIKNLRNKTNPSK